MAKRPTIKSQYQKEYGRLQRAVKRAEKRGYFFEENTLPPKVKKPTRKSLERLRKVPTSSIYDKARVVIEETGEIITGTEARRLERQLAAQKAAETRREKKATPAESRKRKQVEEKLPSMEDIIIRNFIAQVRHYPKSAAPVILPWLDRLISEKGRTAVATMIESARASGILIDQQVAYSERIYTFMADMLDYLPMAPTEKQELTDAFEEVETWEEW